MRKALFGVREWPVGRLLARFRNLPDCLRRHFRPPYPPLCLRRWVRVSVLRDEERTNTFLARLFALGRACVVGRLAGTAGVGKRAQGGCSAAGLWVYGAVGNRDANVRCRANRCLGNASFRCAHDDFIGCRECFLAERLVDWIIRCAHGHHIFRNHHLGGVAQVWHVCLPEIEQFVIGCISRGGFLDFARRRPHADRPRGQRRFHQDTRRACDSHRLPDPKVIAKR